MYIVTSTVVVPPEKTEEVIGIYQNRSRRVDLADGFHLFRLIQNTKKKNELTVHMEWHTKAAYMAWVKSQEFKEIHDLEKNYPDQELAKIIPTVRQYEVVAE
ncbi:heme-degrading monooxygenase HmoA [Planomicrobium stackebrandtii]|uniref:Heme-degrading monooxygenase HmoA n=1 Tax=Planomicrobium stackebrandtii TaxID=253160 RepID=A0ABU0GV79_9BACL|nr:antibiotic biosynthesis monooxygenase family protein [Planomicrobium stackebrandtii]MDQ0428963.1 heme-degrading monooxygenase HmoA [Planomicrobium stackebrandtii]